MTKIETLNKKLKLLCPVTKFKSGKELNTAAWKVQDNNEGLIIKLDFMLSQEIKTSIYKHDKFAQSVKFSDLKRIIEECEMYVSGKGKDQKIQLNNVDELFGLSSVILKREKLDGEI